MQQSLFKVFCASDFYARALKERSTATEVKAALASNFRKIGRRGHYKNGIANGTNQAVKMALDSSGNIYVTGFSQNTNSNLGYVTIKYDTNGQQLWSAQYARVRARAKSLNYGIK